MKKTTLGLASIALAAAFSLSACTNEGELASEACDLLQDQADAMESGDAEKIQEANEALTEFIEENEDKRGSEEEFNEALEEECGDLMP